MMDVNCSCLVLDTLKENTKRILPDNVNVQNLIYNALSYAHSNYGSDSENLGLIKDTASLEAKELCYLSCYIEENIEGKIKDLFLMNSKITNNFITVFTFGNMSTGEKVFELTYDTSDIEAEYDNHLVKFIN